MVRPTFEQPAGGTADPRRLKPDARRKLAVVIGGVVAGGALAFGLETAGVPAQLASTAGGALTALCAAAEELHAIRAEPHSERVARLVRGEVYRHPLLMAFYMVLAIFLVTNVALLPVSFGIAEFVVLTGLNQDFGWEVWEPYVYESAVLAIIVLLPFYMVFIARSIAHRIREHGLLWIFGAVMVAWLIGAAIQRLWDLAPSAEQGGLTPSWEVALDLLSLGLGIGGALAGYLWARRTQTTFVMRKLFRQLSRSDQHDIIDLVKTLPVAGST